MSSNMHNNNNKNTFFSIKIPSIEFIDNLANKIDYLKNLFNMEISNLFILTFQFT